MQFRCDIYESTDCQGWFVLFLSRHSICFLLKLHIQFLVGFLRNKVGAGIFHEETTFHGNSWTPEEFKSASLMLLHIWAEGSQLLRMPVYDPVYANSSLSISGFCLFLILSGIFLGTELSILSASFNVTDICLYINWTKKLKRHPMLFYWAKYIQVPITIFNLGSCKWREILLFFFVSLDVFFQLQAICDNCQLCQLHTTKFDFSPYLKYTRITNLTCKELVYAKLLWNPDEAALVRLNVFQSAWHKRFHYLKQYWRARIGEIIRRKQWHSRRQWHRL